MELSPTKSVLILTLICAMLKDVISKPTETTTENFITDKFCQLNLYEDYKATDENLVLKTDQDVRTRLTKRFYDQPRSFIVQAKGECCWEIRKRGHLRRIISNNGKRQEFGLISDIKLPFVLRECQSLKREEEKNSLSVP